MRLIRIAIFYALFVPAIALASPQTFLDLSNIIVGILNSATGVLVVAGIAIYFYGISINILKFGEGEVEKLKNYFIWGIIVLFVMVSIWGILQILQDTLFGGDQYNPTTGASQVTSPNLFQAPQFTE
jgi:hypothetical protein